MSPNAAIDHDALYYLYVNNEWAGPYQVAHIRELVEQGTIKADDTYAYAAAHQRHYLVEELLAATAAAAATAPAPTANAKTTSAVFDDILDMAPQSSASFDKVLPDLRALYSAYLGVTEHTADPQHALKDLHAAHQGLIQELDHRRSDVNSLSRVINEIDEVGDYLANRHQLTQLWQLLSEMEKVDLAAHPDDGVNSARAVLACLVTQAESKAGSESGSSSSVLLDLAGLDDEADSVITRKILLSARSEVASTKRDMDVLQQTYNELQDQHAKDLEKARKLLEKAEAARAEERHAARQTAAEVRNLAAEIQRLASEPDIAGGSDRDLAEQVARLGEELKTADASTLAYIAEDVLIRMVAELRQLANTGAGGDIGPLRAELALARESLAQAQAQVAQLTNERDALRVQYEQSRITAEKASERAKDREHRLRSTVTALEVTKELHMEVMEDLKSQLQTAQGRVEQMERDLANVRGEMKDSTGSVEARGKAIQHEMQRMVEMKAMLEVRSNELSESLKTAEDELAKAQSSEEGTTLAEALAAKVTQLRTTYEATMNRLREQEANASQLASELEASRREAEELRGRGDMLSSELGEARGSLSAAKHRLDELHQAYARLEAEREALHTELHHRKSTDTIHKQSDTDQHHTDQISKLERDSALLQRQLTAERRQAEQLAEARQNLEDRIGELLSERDDLRRKFEGLQNEHFNDHARHTAAIAVSTQAAIESERRLRELQNRVAELEAQLVHARKSSEGDSLEPTTARMVSQHNALESTDQEKLRSELEQVVRERDQVLAELETIRTSTTSRTAAIPEHVTKRLNELERDLSLAKSEITALDERHSQAVAERDRLRREAERLKGERESAAVEHRTALKSARDRLVESQERVAELERQLSEQAAGERDGQALRGHLDQSLVEQERLSQEVQRLAAELARLNAAVPADRDQQIIGLAKASQQLAGEQEKVLVLTRSLMETLQQADNARGRTLELQEALDQRTNERDLLQQEVDRQRAELTNLRLGVGTGRLPFGELQPTLEKRDQILSELEEVRQELAETRARLHESTRVIKTLESLGGEQNRIKSLEAELEKLRGESDQRQQMFNEARARLVQVSSERDRLAAELAEIKSRPDQSVELKMLRRRLIRAKRMIKRLRRERDEALDERMKSASTLHQLTGQLERLKTAQRAAAEALGLPPSAIPVDAPHLGMDLLPGDASQGRSGMRHHGTPSGTASFYGVRMAGADSAPDTPAVNSAGALQPMRSMTRRLLADSPRGNTPAFTSAFGKPAIPGLALAEQNQAPSQTRLIPAGDAALHEKRHWRPAIPRVRGRMLLLAAGAVVIIGIWSMPPLVPYSMNGVVNASLVRVKAPIEGQFGEMKYQLHDQVEVNQDLVVIRNERADTSEVDGLRARLNNAKSSLAQSERELEEHRASEHSLTTQVAEYQRNLIAQLQRQMEFEQRSMDSLRDTLVNGGSDGALKALNVQRVIVDDLSRRIERLQGGLLADDEKPLFYQRLQEVRLQLAALKVSKENHMATITETESKLVDAEAQLAKRRQAVIRSPIAGTLWQRPSGGNPWVKQGDDVLAMIDPATIHIEAIVSKRYLEDIVPGDQAEVLLLPSKRRITATVQDLRPLEEAPRGDAAQVATGGFEQFRLILSLDDATARGIPVGQKVRLIVTGQEPGLFRRMLNLLYGMGKL